MTERLGTIRLILLSIAIANVASVTENCFTPKQSLPTFVTNTFTVGGAKDAVKVKLDHGGIKMGVRPGCDDGKTGVEVDWDPKDNDPYTCRRGERAPGYGMADGKPVFMQHQLYQPIHECVNTNLMYSEPVPASGAHRPVWPKYGEYLYVPPQRWIHSLEHGAVVFLYHPCSDPAEVEMFRKVVTAISSCKYIITPYRMPCDVPTSVSYWGNISNKPFSLVYWGHTLHLDHFDLLAVTRFIEFFQRALHAAPEYDNYNDGNYELRHISGGCQT